MLEESLGELPADYAALLDLGVVLGQNHAFGLIAGRCSAAQAECLRRLCEEKLYRRCTERWDDFCPRYLKISRSETDRTIKLWEEFGSAYFELSQLTRVSPETFRAIARAIQDGALHYQGEVIALSPANSRKVAAAVAELGTAFPKRSDGPRSLDQQIRGLWHEADVAVRLERLNECCTAVVAEFEKISRDEGIGLARELFNDALTNVRSELGRVAAENGLSEMPAGLSRDRRADRRYDEAVASDLEKQQLREYARLWASNHRFLEDLRDQEIRQADTASAIRMFEQAFRIALRDLPPRGSSGLVQWQDFARRYQRA